MTKKHNCSPVMTDIRLQIDRETWLLLELCMYNCLIMAVRVVILMCSWKHAYGLPPIRTNKTLCCPEVHTVSFPPTDRIKYVKVTPIY